MKRARQKRYRANFRSKISFCVFFKSKNKKSRQRATIFNSIQKTHSLLHYRAKRVPLLCSSSSSSATRRGSRTRPVFLAFDREIAAARRRKTRARRQKNEEDADPGSRLCAPRERRRDLSLRPSGDAKRHLAFGDIQEPNDNDEKLQHGRQLRRRQRWRRGNFVRSEFDLVDKGRVDCREHEPRERGGREAQRWCENNRVASGARLDHVGVGRFDAAVAAAGGTGEYLCRFV